MASTVYRNVRLEVEMKVAFFDKPIPTKQQLNETARKAVAKILLDAVPLTRPNDSVRITHVRVKAKE